MIIYPAIDVKNGKCVRLLKGQADKETIYNHSPINQAKFFEDEGAEFLHIVDLDGAFSGESLNKEVISQVIANVKIPVQVGGGIRSIDDINYWFEMGVSRVILGTVAIKNPSLLEIATDTHPKKIILGIDAKNELVAIEGWVQVSTLNATDLINRFKHLPLSHIVYTDIEKDGSKLGPNFEAIKHIAQKSPFPVIASGGVGSIEDVKRLKILSEFGVSGVIIGKALYDNAFTLKEVISLSK
ncbi:MAG: 1-(5-phosphoribosyl)-5-[(5-phosphoribosylamino)methylideneamino]imidazole-4-carboxamide isomerase [Alphaproteobacteria bacterium]|jgi:phosphoribosylformimino-5-aminoimidazole carboxamide ribotide isomerase